MLSAHPADPTLTTDNLMEVVKGVEDHWDDLSHRLGVKLSKRQKEIQNLCRNHHQRMEGVVRNYMKYHPSPSWKAVAEALQREGLKKQADEVTTKYIKGMDVNHVTCLILIQAVYGQLWYLILVSN